jgi:hypothetical protein
MWDFRVASSAAGSSRRGSDGPLAPPGRYTVRMTLNGKTLTQQLVVRRDPRVRTSDADLMAQYALARDIDLVLARLKAAVDESKELRKKPGANVARIDAIAGPPPPENPRNSIGSPPTAPTAHERAMWTTLRPQAEAALRRWSEVPPKRPT